MQSRVADEDLHIRGEGMILVDQGTCSAHLYHHVFLPVRLPFCDGYRSDSGEVAVTV